MRKLLVVTCVLAGVVFAAGPAPAQEYPPARCSLSLSVSVARRGQTVLASTTNCSSPYRAHVTVTLTLFSEPIFLTNLTADANGQFHDVAFVVPEQATIGQHEVRSTGPGTDTPDLVLNAPLTVVGPGEPGGGGGAQTTAPGLAFTGSDNVPLVWLALILLTIGTVLVLAARRRAQVRRRHTG